MMFQVVRFSRTSGAVAFYVRPDEAEVEMIEQVVADLSGVTNTWARQINSPLEHMGTVIFYFEISSENKWPDVKHEVETILADRGHYPGLVVPAQIAGTVERTLVRFGL